jgi:hypothetical protein
LVSCFLPLGAEAITVGTDMDIVLTSGPSSPRPLTPNVSTDTRPVTPLTDEPRMIVIHVPTNNNNNNNNNSKSSSDDNSIRKAYENSLGSVNEDNYFSVNANSVNNDSHVYRNNINNINNNNNDIYLDHEAAVRREESEREEAKYADNDRKGSSVSNSNGGEYVSIFVQPGGENVREIL